MIVELVVDGKVCVCVCVSGGVCIILIIISPITMLSSHFPPHFLYFTFPRNYWLFCSFWPYLLKTTQTDPQGLMNCFCINFTRNTTANLIIITCSRTDERKVMLIIVVDSLLFKVHYFEDDDEAGAKHAKMKMRMLFISILFLKTA